jgi:hypothetical protein
VTVCRTDLCKVRFSLCQPTLGLHVRSGADTPPSRRLTNLDLGFECPPLTVSSSAMLFHIHGSPCIRSLTAGEGPEVERMLYNPSTWSASYSHFIASVHKHRLISQVNTRNHREARRQRQHAISICSFIPLQLAGSWSGSSPAMLGQIASMRPSTQIRDCTSAALS